MGKGTDCVDLNVSPDGILAYLTLSQEESVQQVDSLIDVIHECLHKNGIIKGVDEKAIRRMAENARNERDSLHPVVVAEGKPPVPCVNGEVAFTFTIDGQMPQIVPDDRKKEVPVKKLTTKKLVRGGTVLAVVKPSHPGEDGYTVKGATLKAKSPTEVHLKAGHGVQLSSDGVTYVVASGEVGYADYDKGTLFLQTPILVSHDGMEAELIVYSIDAAGSVPEHKDVDYWLAQCKVTGGIEPEAIEAALAAARQPGIFVREMIVARGHLPENGENARITFHFKKQTLSGSASENNDRVDYWEREFLHGVREGELLANKIPATPGREGFDVLGKVLPCVPGKDLNLDVTGDAVLSSDGLECHAGHDGVVVAIGQNKVGVYQAYQVPGDVDLKTGNLHMNGVLTIQGWVRAGFKVFASGDVSINGGIEPSVVEVDANLAVKGGIIGGEHALVKTGGALSSFFIDNADVHAGGDITVRDGILGSHVTTDGQVVVTGDKGCIVGGTVIAAQGIEVNELGSRAGIPTIVDVGIDMTTRTKLTEMERDCAIYERNQQKITQAILLLGKKGAAGTLLPTETQALAKIVRYRRDIELKRKSITDYRNRMDPASASIKVHKAVYEGVTVFVFGQRMDVNRDMHYAGEFVLDTVQGRVIYQT